MTPTLLPIRTLHLGHLETVVTLPSRFDSHAVQPFETMVESIVDEARRVSLDGSVVEHIDKAGLESLCRLRRTIEAAGGEISLTNMSLALRIGFELSSLDDLPAERGDNLLVDLGMAA